jgi:hypothetical protein
MDRHVLWRTVARNYDQLLKEAPEGFEPITEVYLSGRADPLEVGQVQSRRDPEFPWVFFVLNNRDRAVDLDTPHPKDMLVWAHEGTILRVEIRYVRASAQPLGFKYMTTADDE